MRMRGVSDFDAANRGGQFSGCLQHAGLGIRDLQTGLCVHPPAAETFKV